MVEEKYSIFGIEMSFEDFERLVNEQGNGKELKVEDGKVIAEYHVPTEEELNMEKRAVLKTELAKVMEDIGQEQLGFVRDDYSDKKARAAEIINELRVLEGKAPREVQA